MIPNPFERRLPDLGRHRLPPRQCDPCADGSYLDLSCTPGVPAPDEVAGHVVLAAGPPHLGKSLFCHICMHDTELSKDRQIIDLSALTSVNSAEESGPNSCLNRLLRQLVKDELLDSGLSEHISEEGLLWADRMLLLREALTPDDGAPVSLLLRLPRLDDYVVTAGGPNRIVEDIVRYAELADYVNDSIVLYEYCHPDAGHWRAMQDRLADIGGAQIHLDTVFGSLSPADALKFLEHRLGDALHDPSLFALDEMEFEALITILEQHGRHFSLPMLNNLFRLAIRAANESANGAAPRLRWGHVAGVAYVSGGPAT